MREWVSTITTIPSDSGRSILFFSCIVRLVSFISFLFLILVFLFFWRKPYKELLGEIKSKKNSATRYSDTIYRRHTFLMKFSFLHFYLKRTILILVYMIMTSISHRYKIIALCIWISLLKSIKKCHPPDKGMTLITKTTIIPTWYQNSMWPINTDLFFICKKIFFSFRRGFLKSLLEISSQMSTYIAIITRQIFLYISIYNDVTWVIPWRYT